MMSRKWKWNCLWRFGMLFFVPAIFVVAKIDRAAAIEPSTSSLRPFQGGWALAYAERDGQPIDSQAARNLGLVVRGNRFTIAPGAQSGVAGTISVKPGTWPQQIDFTPISGPHAGQTFRGIFSTGGDAHQVSFAPPGQPRPTSFNTARNRGQVTYIWKRTRSLSPPSRPFTSGQAPVFQYDW